MQEPEAVQNRYQRSAVPGLLVRIGIVGLLFHSLGTTFFEFIVKELDMADDSESVGKYSSLQCIAEMAVDVLLTDFGIVFGMIRKKGVNSGIGIVTRILFSKGFCLTQLAVKEFRIVFKDARFNSCGIEDKCLRFCGIHFSAERSG